MFPICKDQPLFKHSYIAEVSIGRQLTGCEARNSSAVVPSVKKISDNF